VSDDEPVLRPSRLQPMVSDWGLFVLARALRTEYSSRHVYRHFYCSVRRGCVASL
jgi:hypothetical protein